MMSFAWKNIDAIDYGVVVTTLPPHSTPQRRDKTHQVPGRSGALHIQDGAWEEELKKVEIYLPYAQDGAIVRDIGTLRQWLTGYDWVSFSNIPNRKFKAHIVSAIQFDEWVRGYDDLIATVVFECSPYAYHTPTPSNITLASNNQIITNPGTAESEPRITVNGSGDITLMIAGQILELTGVEGSMVIDSERKEAYKGTTLLNRKMSGDFPELLPGTNAVSWTGSVTSLVIAPNWRDI